MFRYEAVLRVRKYKEDLLKKEVGRIIAGIEFEENILGHIEDEIEKSLDEVSHLQKRRISIFDLKEWDNYIIWLHNRQKEQEKRIEELKNELDSTRKKLVVASQEKRVIERLKEKYEIKKQIEEERKESFNLDEIGLSLFERGVNVLSLKK
ncbi:MAG: flagellar export protein FliJ [bacterium]